MRLTPRLVSCMILISCMLGFGCKKKDFPSGGPNPPNSNTILLGGIAAPDSAFTNVPSIDEIDLSQLTPLSTRKGVVLSLPVILNVPPPQQQRFQDCSGWAVGYGLLGYYYNKINGDTNYFPYDTANFSPLYLYSQINRNAD